MHTYTHIRAHTCAHTYTHTQLWMCFKCCNEEKCLSWRLRDALPLFTWRKLKQELFKTLWIQSRRSGLEVGELTSGGDEKTCFVSVTSGASSPSGLDLFGRGCVLVGECKESLQKLASSRLYCWDNRNLPSVWHGSTLTHKEVTLLCSG